MPPPTKIPIAQQQAATLDSYLAGKRNKIVRHLVLLLNAISPPELAACNDLVVDNTRTPFNDIYSL